MITVVHVITKLELGGAQENTLYTCQHLDRSRFRVVLMYGPGGLLDDALSEMAHNTELIAVPEMVRSIVPGTDAVCFSALRKHFWRLQADHWKHQHDKHTFIVHTHSSKAGFLGRTAARAAEVPRIVHTIHGWGFHEGQARLKRLLFVRAERWAGRVTDAFVSVSRANLAEAQARGIILPHQHREVIRSGMDLDVIRNAQDQRDSVRANLGLTDDDLTIVNIANFKPQKDPLTLVRAMHTLVRDHPRAVLLMVGDGPLRTEVEASIQHLGLERHIRLLGWRRDVPELLAAADVVALSSIFEGLPRSAVQAVAARRPFVGTRVDGTPEIIRDGKNGFLVPPRQPAALARALARALEERPIDPTDVERVREWETSRMVERLEMLYEQLVERPPS